MSDEFRGPIEPLHRRFGDESERERAEARARLTAVSALAHRDLEADCRVTIAAIKGASPYYDRAIAITVRYLLGQEKHLYERATDHIPTGMVAFARHQEMVRRKYNALTDPTYWPRLHAVIVELLSYLFSQFPHIDAPSPFEVPLLSVTPHARDVVQHLFYLLSRQPFLDTTCLQMSANLERASGGPNKQLKQPHESKLPLEALADEYLQDTIFRELFALRVPLHVPIATRLRHAHILGNTGSGKSTLLENLILHDLQSEACVVVIEPHHQLIDRLARLRHDKNVVLITPELTPAINVFDAPAAASDQRAFSGVVDTLAFLFRDADTKLSGRQFMVFQYLCRLMLSIPNATLVTLLEFLEQPQRFQSAIDRQPTRARAFFADFLNPKSNTYRATPEQLRSRLHGIFANRALEEMFSAPKTKLNMRAEMDRGSLILIDADDGELGNAHEVFGKIFLDLIMETARQRGTDAYPPTFVYVDEAHHFFDDQINKFLTDARKFNVGITLAHQHLGEVTSPVIRGALQGASTKLAGFVRAEDARAVADDMRTTAEAIRNVPQYQFAFYAHGITPTAVPVAPQDNPLGALARLADTEYQALRRDNRARYAADSTASSDTTSADRFDEPDSDEW